MYLFIGPYAVLHDLLHAHLHFTCTYKPVTLIKHTTLYLACQPGVSGLYVLCFGMSLFLLSTYLLYLSGILGRILHRWNYVLRFMCLFVWVFVMYCHEHTETRVQSCTELFGNKVLNLEYSEKRNFAFHGHITSIDDPTTVHSQPLWN